MTRSPTIGTPSNRAGFSQRGDANRSDMSFQQICRTQPEESGRRTIDGYVADTLYPSMFHQRFTPEWTDAVLLQHFHAPPRGAREPFTLIDVGCGDGYGLILNAAAHPEGQFLGIDASLAHVERGQSLVRELGLPNVELRHATFASAARDVTADYITAQGVLSWVTAPNRAALWQFAQDTLKSGGALTVGYNTMPGWGWLLTFQRLLRALAEPIPGNSTERFHAALETLRSSGSVSQDVLAHIDEDRKGTARDYYAHEYLNDGWEPLWSNDVGAVAAAHALQFVCNADAVRWRDDFAFTTAQRQALAAMPNRRARELTADAMLNTCFRLDVFVRSPSLALTEDARDALKLDSVWMARSSEEEAKYFFHTQAGKIGFDNAAAHAILRTLAQGPQSLRAVSGLRAADLLNTIDALAVAGLVQPAHKYGRTPHAARIHTMVENGTIPIDTVVTPFGAMRRRVEKGAAEV